MNAAVQNEQIVHGYLTYRFLLLVVRCAVVLFDYHDLFDLLKRTGATVAPAGYFKWTSHEASIAAGNFMAQSSR
jgi:hypothetical protein